MDLQRLDKLYRWLTAVGQTPDNCLTPVDPPTITWVMSEVTWLDTELRFTKPFLSKELTNLKKNLFYGTGILNHYIWGQILEVLKFLKKDLSNPQPDIWLYGHPTVIMKSKKLFEDGHYASAVEAAFKEINSRIKKIYLKYRHEEKDGQALMRLAFKPENPLLKFESMESMSGRDTQEGYWNMFAGAMQAVRNPNAHENLILSEREAVHHLMFASMLMYKIDEAIAYSKLEEG